MERSTEGKQRTITERKYQFIFIFSLIIFAGMIIANFTVMYRGAKQNMINSQEKKVIQSASEVESSLIEGIDTVKMTAYTLEHLLSKGADNQKILSYLKQQTEIYEGTIDSEFTGIYGIFDGKYLDGSGWVPDDGYDPTKRPWYQTIMAAKGQTALVTPYLDADTGSMMMTIGQLLSDKKNIVALDIRMDSMQKIMKELVKEDPDNLIFVLDEDGSVVAHSVESEAGKEYLDEKNSLGNKIAQKIYSSQKQHFEIRYEGTKYLVFFQKIHDKWMVVTVMDEKQLLRPLTKINIVLLVVLLFFIGSISYIFSHLNRNRRESADLNEQLKSLARIYASMHVIDLERDTFTTISNTEDIKKLLGESNDHAQYALHTVMDVKTAKQFKKAILAFTDLTTLGRRLARTDTITMEFVDNKNKWCRARFTIVDRDEKGNLLRVMWMIENIDEEKRQREKLLYLSETDRMTGINNRGSGEAKIREMLSMRRGGMFCLLDADHFKSINDTLGHGVGDKVIIAIADCLKKTFRETDIVMRLGGDEFAAYAPTVMNEEAGRVIVDRFFENIQNTHIPEMGTRPILVSMGVAFYQYSDTFPFEELYKRADSCTYQSKKTEGNMVTYYKIIEQGR